MAIEFFTKSGRGYSPKVSIRKQGQIGLNQGAVARYKIKEWDYVLLGYDREQNMVGLKLLKEEKEGAKKLMFRQGSASISAKAFLDYFNIPYDQQAKQYALEKNEEAGCLVFFLTDKQTKGGDAIPENQ